MVIREYQQTDCEKLADLFYSTVHTVNAKDYTKEQLSGSVHDFVYGSKCCYPV